MSKMSLSGGFFRSGLRGWGYLLVNWLYLLDLCVFHPFLEEFPFKLSMQRCQSYVKFSCTVKPVLSGHSKIDKTKVLMTDCSFMKVKSIAEHSAMLLICIR